MNLSGLVNRGIQQAVRHSPEILTALGITGVVTTAYLAGKAAFKSCDIIRATENVAPEHPYAKRMREETKNERFARRAKMVGTEFIPPVVVGAATIGAIYGSHRVSVHRTAVAVAAYSLTEQRFSSYREKVVEKLGERKEQEVRDELAQEQVERSSAIIVSGTDGATCMELYTGRAFVCDIEKLRQAVNEINAQIVNGVYATLSDFYHLIGLPPTTESSNLGWDSDRLMSLHFSSVLHNGRPLMTFEYNYVKPI